MNWLNNFDERQQKEIEFCVLYLNQFEHGTDGHNAKVIIAKMAIMLSNVESIAYELASEIQSDKSYGEKRTIDLSYQLVKVLSK